MFESEQSLWMVICIVIAVAFFLQRFKIFSMFGPPILCIVMGAILANIGLVPHWNDSYGVVVTYAVPLAMGMYLINIDIKGILGLSKSALVALMFAMGSVSVMALIGAVIFHSFIPEAWKYTGMFIGTYTGGSANLTAVGTALNATSEQLAAANAADYVVGMPVLIFLFALPSLIARSKLLKKLLPHTMKEAELVSDDEPELFAPKSWSVVDLAMLFGIAFLLLNLGSFISGFAPEEFQKAVNIISITTLAIILSQFKSVQKIKGNMEVGIYISSFFLVVIGFMIDIEKFLTSIPQIAMYCAFVLFGSMALCYSLCHFFKVKYQYMVIAFMASMGDGTAAAIIAASAKWRSLVQVAILLGMTGFVCGNYLGIGFAYAVKYFTG